MSEEQKRNQKEFNIDELIRDDKEKTFEVDEIEYSIVELSVQDEIDNVKLYTDKNGKVSGQLAKILQLTQMKKIPYTKNHIQKMLGIEKEWEELTIEERFNFLMKFKSEYLSALITASDKALQNYVMEEGVKN